jgi:hypothetical protein
MHFMQGKSVARRSEPNRTAYLIATRGAFR